MSSKRYTSFSHATHPQRPVTPWRLRAISSPPRKDSRSPLERCPRDIRTASQHVSTATANYELIGRVLLGLPPDRPVNRL